MPVEALSIESIAREWDRLADELGAPPSSDQGGRGLGGTRSAKGVSEPL
jgi:hypothetical protein